VVEVLLVSPRLIRMEAETIYSSIARSGEAETGKENLREFGRSVDIQEQNQDP
jgi:hypothetical protein